MGECHIKIVGGGIEVTFWTNGYDSRGRIEDTFCANEFRKTILEMEIKCKNACTFSEHWVKSKFDGWYRGSMK